tara:strand:- start:546 stop:749 length:204 start_codon:yes stop_codon:yes gene_type:complete
MNKNRKNNICMFCEKQVIIYDNTCNGHMAINNRIYHFDCVVKYNYQKFCSEIIEDNKNKEQLEKKDY